MFIFHRFNDFNLVTWYNSPYQFQKFCLVDCNDIFFVTVKKSWADFKAHQDDLVISKFIEVFCNVMLFSVEFIYCLEFVLKKIQCNFIWVINQEFNCVANNPVGHLAFSCARPHSLHLTSSFSVGTILVLHLKQEINLCIEVM